MPADSTTTPSHSRPPVRVALPRGGPTPLFELARIIPRAHARVLVKCESLVPLHSIKDRVAAAMVAAAERDGLLAPGGRIVEPTNGNTGVALARVAASRGYRMTVVLPEGGDPTHRAILACMGAEVVVTPGLGDLRPAVARAEEIAARLGAFMPRQFDNPANPAIHEATTGPEIWAASDGRVDVFVAGVGTGGTLTGVTRALRRRNPAVLGVAVEPAGSAVLSGGAAGRHGLQGIGVGFVPRNLDRSLVAAVETVSDEEAAAWARRLAREEGIPAGLSAGANVAVAARLAARSALRGSTIVTVMSGARAG